MLTIATRRLPENAKPDAPRGFVHGGYAKQKYENFYNCEKRIPMCGAKHAVRLRIEVGSFDYWQWIFHFREHRVPTVVFRINLLITDTTCDKVFC